MRAVVSPSRSLVNSFCGAVGQRTSTTLGMDREAEHGHVLDAAEPVQHLFSATGNLVGDLLEQPLDHRVPRAHLRDDLGSDAALALAFGAVAEGVQHQRLEVILAGASVETLGCAA